MKYTVTGTLRQYSNPKKPAFTHATERSTKPKLLSETEIGVQTDSPCIADELVMVFKNLGMTDVLVSLTEEVGT